MASTKRGSSSPQTLVTLVDGDCALCSGYAQCVSAMDTKGRVYFETQQSEAGQALLRRANMPMDLSTVVMLECGGGHVRGYTKSTAVLRTFRFLGLPMVRLCLFFFVFSFHRRDGDVRKRLPSRYVALATAAEATHHHLDDTTSRQSTSHVVSLPSLFLLSLSFSLVVVQAVLFFIGVLVPRCVRDCVYDLVARNRHRLFGTNGGVCKLPDKVIRKRMGRSLPSELLTGVVEGELAS